MVAWMLTSPEQALGAYRTQIRMASLAGWQLTSVAALWYPGVWPEKPGTWPSAVEAPGLHSQL